MGDKFIFFGGNLCAFLGSTFATIQQMPFAEQLMLWVTTLTGAVVTIIAGFSRILKNRAERHAAEAAARGAEYKARAARDRANAAHYRAKLAGEDLCAKCKLRPEPFKKCGIPKEYCVRKNGVGS